MEVRVGVTHGLGSRMEGQGLSKGFTFPSLKLALTLALTLALPPRPLPP